MALGILVLREDEKRIKPEVRKVKNERLNSEGLHTFSLQADRLSGHTVLFPMYGVWAAV